MLGLFLLLSLNSHFLTELSWDGLSRMHLEYLESFSSLPSGKSGVRNRIAWRGWLSHEGMGKPALFTAEKNI